MNGNIIAKKTVPTGPINIMLSGINHHEFQLPVIIETSIN